MTTPLNPQPDFNEITQLIHAVRCCGEYGVDRVVLAGEFISRKIAQADCGGTRVVVISYAVCK